MLGGRMLQALSEQEPGMLVSLRFARLSSSTRQKYQPPPRWEILISTIGEFFFFFNVNMKWKDIFTISLIRLRWQIPHICNLSGGTSTWVYKEEKRFMVFSSPRNQTQVSVIIMTTATTISSVFGLVFRKWNVPQLKKLYLFWKTMISQFSHPFRKVSFLLICSMVCKSPFLFLLLFWWENSHDA